MARRHLEFTVTVTLDEDACRELDTPSTPDGDSVYQFAIDDVRTRLVHHTALMLTRLDPVVSADVRYTGITYETQI